MCFFSKKYLTKYLVLRHGQYQENAEHTASSGTNRVIRSCFHNPKETQLPGTYSPLHYRSTYGVMCKCNVLYSSNNVPNGFTTLAVIHRQ